MSRRAQPSPSAAGPPARPPPVAALAARPAGFISPSHASRGVDGDAPAAGKGPVEPAYRIPPDEDVVAAALRAVLRAGTVDSQRKLGEMVEAELRRRDRHYRVSDERVRVLALRSGLVGVHVHAHPSGPTPRLERCPVCESDLVRTSNRTLAGGATATGYRCARCPWWTGREYRVPSRYVFFPLVERAPRSPQLSFRPSRP